MPRISSCVTVGLATVALNLSLTPFAWAASASIALASVTDFSPVRTSDESMAQFDDRAKAVIDTYFKMPVEPFRYEQNRGFGAPSIARAYKGEKLDEVEKMILDPKAVVYGLPGADSKKLKFICYRNGDYDFALISLTRLAYLIQINQRPFSSQAWHKLTHVLLSQTGNRHHTHFTVGKCGTYADSENHVLQTESSRYLANQLRFRDGLMSGLNADSLEEFDNEKNGFNEWILKRLQKNLIFDMTEYNSRPYEGLTYTALQNLYDFAESEKVKTMSGALLNYLAAKHAIQSNLLRKLAPYDRQIKYVIHDEITLGDTSFPRYWVLVGNVAQENYESATFTQNAEIYFMLFPATGVYRVPRPILDLYFHGNSASAGNENYWQRFSHSALEIYDVYPRALVTAGGVYFNFKGDYGTFMMDGWAYPTTLMPLGTAKSYKDLIRFNGHFLPTRKRNICVTKNFACGINPKIPKSIPEKCTIRAGNYTFIDLKSQGCPDGAGLFVAFYQKKCDSVACFLGALKWGFWETYEPKTGETLQAFAEKTQLQNQSRRFTSNRNNRYTLHDGTDIVFRPLVSKFTEYPIRSRGAEAFNPNVRQWGLAEGDFIQAARDAQVRIRNPWTGGSVMIDARDPLNPEVTIQP